MTKRTVTRRIFQHLALLLFPLTLGGAATAAALRFLWPPAAKPRQPFLELDEKPEQLKKKGAAPVEIEFNDEKVFVLWDGQQFLAVESTCTHLGCAVTWAAKTSTFDCPCHGAQFESNGVVRKKPANGPLKQFTIDTAKLAEGRLVVLDRVQTREGGKA